MKNEPKLSAKMKKRLKKFLTDTWGWSYEYGEWLDEGGQPIGGIKDLQHFLATALEEQKQKVLSEVEGWMVELRKQAGLCNDAANSHLEQQRASRLVEMICDIVAKLEEMKK